jgi:hypothetical protein
VAKKLGEMWNNLSDNEKQPYVTKAAKLKEKYEKVRDGAEAFLCGAALLEETGRCSPWC